MHPLDVEAKNASVSSAQFTKEGPIDGDCRRPLANLIHLSAKGSFKSKTMNSRGKSSSYGGVLNLYLTHGRGEERSNRNRIKLKALGGKIISAAVGLRWN